MLDRMKLCLKKSLVSNTRTQARTRAQHNLTPAGHGVQDELVPAETLYDPAGHRTHAVLKQKEPAKGGGAAIRRGNACAGVSRGICVSQQ